MIGSVGCISTVQMFLLILLRLNINNQVKDMYMYMCIYIHIIVLSCRFELVINVELTRLLDQDYLL